MLFWESGKKKQQAKTRKEQIRVLGGKKKGLIHFKLGRNLVEKMTFNSRSENWKKPAVETRNVGQANEVGADSGKRKLKIPSMTMWPISEMRTIIVVLLPYFVMTILMYMLANVFLPLSIPLPSVNGS